MQHNRAGDAGDGLTVLHASVPGRVRVHVRNLNGQGRDGLTVTDLLRSQIAARSDVADVRVSALTGNITVSFSPATDMREMLAHLRACLERMRSGEYTPSCAGSAGADGWTAMSAQEVAARHGVSLNDGLSYRRAARRLREHGPNTLIPAPVRSSAEILLAQFSGAPVVLLAGAAGYSLYIGALVEAFAIGAVVTANALIGYMTEAAAEASITSLLPTEIPKTRVVREGKEAEIDARDLVPGEIIQVERGDVVPADARIVHAEELLVSEAALTGESAPVHKHAEPLADPTLPLAERANMLYRGAIVVSGFGRAIVTATGASTEIGKIQRLAAESRPPETPTHAQLTVLGAQVVRAAAGASVLMVVLGLLRGSSFLTLLRSAISLAVAAIPEGLSVIATVSHAVGVDVLRRQNVIVRRPDALETLASVDVICLDKTGTLTENSMSVAEIRCSDLRAVGPGIFPAPDAASPDPVGRLLRIVALCNEAEVSVARRTASFSGTSTETALLSAAARRGIDVGELRRANPQEWIREKNGAWRYMVSRHAGPSGAFLAVKGAPLEVLRRCVEDHAADGSRRPLTSARRDEIERGNKEMAARGLRVLGGACGDGKALCSPDEIGSVGDLVWLGLVGLEDPVRESARAAIRELSKSGVRPLILTGDQFLTAQAVAEKVGVTSWSRGKIIDAAELETLSLDDLAKAAKEVSVLARVTPAQKLRIVEALQHSGSVVAMVGDGVNDSPALRKADVGVALSMHADAAARDVADIVLRTDDLRMIARAVACGRTVYGNIRKALNFLLSTNSSEVLLLLGGALAGRSDVLTPMQLLWINLITDVGPGIGLAVGAPDADVLSRPPYSRRSEFLNSGEAGALLREGAFLAMSGVAAGLYGAVRYGPGAGQVRTLMFTGLIAAQLDHALTSRAEYGQEAQRPPSNRTLSLILAGSAVAQSLVLLSPALRRLLGLTPLGLLDAMAMLTASAVPAVIRRTFPRERGVRKEAGDGQSGGRDHSFQDRIR